MLQYLQLPGTRMLTAEWQDCELPTIRFFTSADSRVVDYQAWTGSYVMWVTNIMIWMVADCGNATIPGDSRHTSPKQSHWQENVCINSTRHCLLDWVWLNDWILSLSALLISYFTLLHQISSQHCKTGPRLSLHPSQEAMLAATQQLSRNQE